MFVFSSKTQVNKKFRFQELFKLMSADKAVRADAKTVLSVTLTNVLSSDTLNLSASGKVKEIYVFDIELSSKTIPTLFISSLDKAINLNTMFLLHHDGKEMLYGAYKERTDKCVKIGKYYGTDWKDQSEQIIVPLDATSLDEIYKAMIGTLIPLSADDEEDTGDFVARYEQVTKLKKEIDKLQSRVDAEKQSKKRFELNEQLKQMKKELEEIC
ncbi:MAG TPA: hypothetical protein DE061_00405 [Clostridiales bacterium]|nr:hypothetical protein [Clostridiales bacterium]